MKISFKKFETGEYQSGIYRGRGGVSSLIASRCGNFWYCLGVFSIKNIYRALTW
jgi:hypothetical protein